MYLVKFADNTEIAVDIRQSVGRRGQWEARLPNGEVLILSMRGKDDNANFVIAIDGVETSVSFHPTADGYQFTQNQYTEIVTVSRAADLIFDESEGTPKETTPQAGDSALRSPITGIVLDVFASVGEKVPSGTPLVLIEAMKMENTLEAPGERVIEKVLVKAGDTVFVGDPLVLYKENKTDTP